MQNIVSDGLLASERLEARPALCVFSGGAWQENETDDTLTANGWFKSGVLAAVHTSSICPTRTHTPVCQWSAAELMVMGRGHVVGCHMSVPTNWIRTFCCSKLYIISPE